VWVEIWLGWKAHDSEKEKKSHEGTLEGELNGRGAFQRMKGAKRGGEDSRVQRRVEKR